MRLHPAGIVPVLGFLIPGLLLLLLAWRGGWSWLGWPGLALLGLGLFLAWFFRDPERTSPADPGLLLSAADGRVIQVRRWDHRPELNGPALQVSVFMSPLDVHVNRSTVAGRVARVDYRPGKYLVAFNEKSSELNEACTVVLDFEHRGRPRRLAMIQIAGFLARRVVCQVRPGDSLRAGQRYGIIKLGSRLDHFLPADAQPMVAEGRRVRGGETVIGVLP